MCGVASTGKERNGRGKTNSTTFNHPQCPLSQSHPIGDSTTPHSITPKSTHDPSHGRVPAGR